VRLAVVLLLIAACDLKPQQGDKRTPTRAPAATPDAGAAPVPPPPGSNAPVDVPPPSARIDAGVRPTPTATTDACTEVGVHVADLKIAAASDPTMKAQLEQDKTRLVRRVAEACTRDNWSDAVRKCFIDGKTDAETTNCVAPK
jgi:hypothetical protein